MCQKEHSELSRFATDEYTATTLVAVTVQIPILNTCRVQAKTSVSQRFVLRVLHEKQVALI